MLLRHQQKIIETCLSGPTQDVVMDPVRRLPSRKPPEDFEVKPYFVEIPHAPVRRRAQ